MKHSSRFLKYNNEPNVQSPCAVCALSNIQHLEIVDKMFPVAVTLHLCIL